jgi:hypothetical protein
MEGPIAFDVWIVATAATRADLEALLQRGQPGLPRLQLLQRIAKARLGAPILVAARQSWDRAQRWQVAAAEGRSDVRTYQSGYEPSDEGKMRFCDTHRLFYGGCLECPVCCGCAL